MIGVGTDGDKHGGIAGSWSDEDQEFVATCAEFPALSWLEPAPERALGSGFIVRVPPQLHRSLATQAAESGISLNRLVTHKLSRQG